MILWIALNKIGNNGPTHVILTAENIIYLAAQYSLGSRQYDETL